MRQLERGTPCPTPAPVESCWYGILSDELRGRWSKSAVSRWQLVQFGKTHPSFFKACFEQHCILEADPECSRNEDMAVLQLRLTLMRWRMLPLSDWSCVISVAAILSCLRRQRGIAMAWTETTRAKYQREGLRYASDTTDAEWSESNRTSRRPRSAGGRAKPSCATWSMPSSTLPSRAANGAFCLKISRRIQRCSAISTLGGTMGPGRI